MYALNHEKMLKYTTNLVGLFSIAAVLCFLVYTSMAHENSRAAYDLGEHYVRDNLAVTLEQKSFDDAIKASRDLDSAKSAKNGAELALLSFIALNVVYYVHFK